MPGPTERQLTITLDGDSLDFEALVQAVEDFRNLLTEVDKSVGQGRRTLRWVVTRLQRSSPAVIAVSPHPVRQGEPDTSDLVTRAVVDGLAQLEEGKAYPSHYSERALMAAQRLADLRRSHLQHVRVSLVAGALAPASVEVTERVIASVTELTGARYCESGAVGGTIEVVSIHGRDRFNVYDSLTGRRVDCFTDETTAKVLGAFLGRRVLVEGEVHSNARGEPLSVTVKGYRILRERNELPQPEDLLGLFKSSEFGSKDLGDFLRGGERDE